MINQLVNAVRNMMRRRRQRSGGMYSWVARMGVEIIRALGGEAEVVPSRRNPPWSAVRLRVPGSNLTWVIDEEADLISMIHRQLAIWERQREAVGVENKEEE